MLFDTAIMVDWSAASTPKRGKDSIWWAMTHYDADGLREAPRYNPATRGAAMTALADTLADLSAAGRRVLIGFDFPFGYPAGFAAALGKGGAPWRATWEMLAELIADDDSNDNNRFAVAATLNGRLAAGFGPFWGHPHGHHYAGLATKKPVIGRERRLIEQRVQQAKAVWQLNGAGSVGGQALVGLPRLLALRQDPRLRDRTRVWPFETGLTAPQVADGDIVIAEIYPSLVEPDPREAVKDAGQVRAVANHLARADQAGTLAAMFGVAGLSADQRRAVETEEAWILGVDPETKTEEPPRTPEAITAASFAMIDEAVDLSGVAEDLRPLAARLVHSCGDAAIVDRLRASDTAAQHGMAALAQGATVLTDAEMVARGVTRRFLPAENTVMCTLGLGTVAGAAQRGETTRSAAAVEAWPPWLEGAVVAIGNAPTALFRLLQGLEDGWPRPALVIGMPVGFVGAAEAKDALAEAGDKMGLAYITLRGRAGGSALAAAAVNALARQATAAVPS